MMQHFEIWHQSNAQGFFCFGKAFAESLLSTDNNYTWFLCSIQTY